MLFAKFNLSNLLDLANVRGDIFFIKFFSAFSVYNCVIYHNTFENAGKESIDVSLLPLIDIFFKSLRVYSPTIFYILLLSIIRVYSFIKWPIFYIFYIHYYIYLYLILSQVQNCQHFIIL